MKLKKVTDVYKQTDLWKHFNKKAKAENVALVEKLVEDAAFILDRIIETFPTYTLHNGQHQLNLLKNVSYLLGKRMKELSDLESAFLILSIFYHDIGMVFSEEEREKLREEPEFKNFLSVHPSAQLAIQGKDELPIDIAEWYCRWTHAKRVWIYLNKVEDKLLWDDINFRKELAEVCLSHNEDAGYLKSEAFQNDFLIIADLRFCATILRLADILDFDNTRSPQSVFEYLKLDNPQTSREQISYEEWSKHLASNGFSFKEWNKISPYELDFIAAPKHPAVENDIREFLDTIELELQKCSTLLKFCSKRWNDFILPNKINRDNILSQGYKYGNYKFSLDQDQILNLLMGENLYDDHYVFIRELLQNAIDTSRHREFHEHKKGNKSFISDPIEISNWIDTDGYRWIRIDDYGMGMSEEAIKKFFLKVGSSYYNSGEFKVRKLEYKNDGIDFTPISRFGIGILSCFIAGDLVEVNTCSIECNNKDIYPIRLSLKGLHNFYVMQTDKDTPSAMPCDSGTESKYRTRPGTSIAVRIRVDKDPVNFNLKEILDKTILNPPIKVFLKNSGLIGNYPEIMHKKWCDNYTLNISAKDTAKIEEVFGVKIKSKLQVHLFSIDLSKYSPNINLSGHIAIVYAPIPEVDYSKKNSKSISEDIVTSFSLYGLKPREEYYFDPTHYWVDIEYEYRHHLREDGADSRVVKIILDEIKNKISFINTPPYNNFSFSNIILTHNGIGIPNNRDILKSEITNLSIRIMGLNYKDGVDIIGLVELRDELRPNLSISRNKITGIDWNILSQLNYTIYKGLQDSEIFKNNKHFDFVVLDNLSIKEMFYKDFLSDKLITELDFWVKEKIIATEGENISIEEIIQTNDIILLNQFYFGANDLSIKDDFRAYLTCALLQCHCDLIFKLYYEKHKDGTFGFDLPVKTFASKRSNLLIQDLDLFPPFTFVKYENFDGLCPEHLIRPNADDEEENLNSINFEYINIEHKFSQWFIKSSKILLTNYSVHFWSLLRAKEIDSINETLQRLRKILPEEFKPTNDLILTEKDLIVDLSELEEIE